MNKPRPSALPLKKAIRVSPPTPPGGFFSFSSFRVKKGSQGGKGGGAGVDDTASNRRRTASGDCEPTYSSYTCSNLYGDPSDDTSWTTSWAAAVVSPLATQKLFNANSANAEHHGGNSGCRLSTFKTFSTTTESAPSSPCTGQDYRFLKESANFPRPSRQTIAAPEFSTETRNFERLVPGAIPSFSFDNDQQGYGVGAGSSAGIEMHKGYYDHKSGLIADTSSDLHGKPPSGVIRHHPLRSNSEPHGGHYYGVLPTHSDLGGPPPPAPQNHHLPPPIPPHHPLQQQQHHHVSAGGIGPVTSNVYASHHILLEDQGIDMSQSPGHESPSSTVSSNTISVSGGSGVSSSVGSGGSGGSAGSGGSSGAGGCRHSAASFDSGRASSTLYQQGVRYSGLSSESSSTGSCRHSYHSSSSSLGSIPPEEICNFDVSSMIAQGLADSEILNAWLTGVHFECYYQNFIQAGYDMQTIVKMTPEDLNAIGITKPNHRKRLKSEISQLIIPDGLLDYIPSSIEEWLRALRMEEYEDKLKAQGYLNVRQVTNIMWEDLEEIGILKLGHQKKFLLAIKRVEDILSGKRLHVSAAGSSGGQNSYHPAMDVYAVPRQVSQPLPNPALITASQMPYHHHPSHNMHSGNQGPPPTTARAYLFHQQQKSFPPSQQQQQSAVPPPSFSSWRQHSLGSSGVESHYSSYNPLGENLYSTVNNNNSGGTAGNDSKPHPHLQLLTHQPQIHPEKPPPSSQTASNGQPEYHPEVIAIHVKGDRRPSTVASDHCGEPIYGTSSFQAPGSGVPSSSTTTSALRPGGGKWVDDGETTPTNEADSRTGSGSVYPMMDNNPSSTTVSSFGTLPRLMKNKNLAKTGSVGSGDTGGPPGDPTATNLDITYQDQLHWQQQQQQQIHQNALDGYKSLPKNMGRFQNSTFRGNPTAGPLGGCGRQPPPPPRRSSSTTTQDTSNFSTFHPSASSSSATIKRQSSWSNCSHTGVDDSDLPAPPPPEDLALISGPIAGNPSVPPPSASQHRHPQYQFSSQCSSNFTSNASSSPSLSSTASSVASASTTNNNNLSSTDYQHNHRHPSSATASSFANSSTNPVVSSSSYSSYCSSNPRSIHHPSGNTPTGSGSVAAPPVGTGRLRDPSPGAESSESFATVGVRRNGSDASFKSSSSTESESIPFANDNAGTIKQQKSSAAGGASRTGGGSVISALEGVYGSTSSASTTGPSAGEHLEAGDVLSDIGNMLADLTDELDAILQQEMDSLSSKR